MRYTLPGRPKLPPLKLINRINDSDQGCFVFTALFEGARSKTSYRISHEEIRIFAGNAFGGGEILKNSSMEEKLRRLASDITAETLFQLRVSGYLELSEIVRCFKKAFKV
jgi:hypothetical protein